MHIGEHGARSRAFDPRAFCPQRAGDARIVDLAGQIGADRDGAGQVEQLGPGQPPKRVGGAIVAHLREQRGVGEPLDEIARTERRQARLRTPDRLAARCHDRAQPHAVGVEHAREPHVDGLRGEHEASTAESFHRHVDPPGRCAAAALRISELARSAARQPEAGIADVEHRERHAREGRIDREPVAGILAAQFAFAACEIEARGRQPPAVTDPRHHGGRHKRGRAAVDRARRGDGVAIRRRIGGKADVESTPARAAQLRRHLPGAVPQRCGDSEATEHEAALPKPRAVGFRFDRDALGVEQCDEVELAAPQPCSVGDLRVGGFEMRFDPLHLADRRKGKRAARRPRHIEPSVEAARHRAQTAARVHLGPVECGNRDRRLFALGQQNRSAPVEGAERRPAAGGEGKAFGRRVEMRDDIAQAHRFVGMREFQVDCRTFDPPVEREAERAILALGACPFEMHTAVAPQIAIAGDADVRGGEHQIVEMQNAVGRLAQRGGGARQPARE